MPKVSVLMAVYKTNEKYLREAIESILSQTYKDFEFLILDDCPSDSRESIVKSYNDERIKYFKNKVNLGISKTRNKLIDLSSGEYLAVFDHDDISLPTRFEKEVEYLDNNPDVGVVSCNFKTLIKQKESSLPNNNEDIKLGLMGGCVILHPASMIRKSVLIDNNVRYEEEFSPAEDYMMWCRLIKYTKFHNINEVLFHYRDHTQNISHTQNTKMIKVDILIKSIIKKEYQDLYNTFLSLSRRTYCFKLFNLIPIITIEKLNRKVGIYLFNKIPLLSIKIKVKL